MFCFVFCLRATDVSGTISANATWNLAGSPYNLVGYTRVNPGITLSIDPGVVVVGNATPLEINGTLNANGTPSAMIIFTNAIIAMGTNQSYNNNAFFIIIRNSHLMRCSVFGVNGNAGHGNLTLEDSQIENPSDIFYLWYPIGNCSIRRNIFVGAVPTSYGFALIYVGTQQTNKIFIQDNVFNVNGVAVGNWASYNTSMTIVSGNNFLRTNFPTVVLPSGGYTSANMIATNNYWGKTSTAVINQMIYDKNDAADSANYISYVPFLSAPNPSAVQVPLPSIQADPQSQSVFTGDTVSFTVQASGLGNLSYQWHAGVTDLPGKTNSTLTLTNVQQGQAGAYSVTVRNFEGGGVDSQIANLSVQPRPQLPLLLGIAPATSLAFTNLKVGTNYQLQVSQSAAWVNLGLSFTADATNYMQYFDGTIDGSIYRLMALPLPYGATATPILAYGFVVAATVNDGGYGYVSAPAVQIIGGGGGGAQSSATVSNGVVTAINMSNAGFGYTSLPTIQIDPPPVPALLPNVAKAFRMDYSGLTPALTYQLQASLDLSGWVNYGTNFIATDYTNSQYINIGTNWQFFRLLLQTSP